MSTSELITVVVDGREIEVPKGTGMVETAASAGIEIPVFCYEPRLGPPLGACRMCLCEVEGMPKLQAACTLTAQEGMVLRTAQTSEMAAEGQNAILEFILLNHPLDCPDCDKGGECPLQDLTFRWGPGSTRMHFPKRTFDKPIPISPLIALDRERCILCYRCTRFSDGVSEDGQLVAVERGANSYIATFQDEPYRAHFSGNVTELCPVGALLPIPYRFRARPWEIQNVPSVCGLCPVGCPVSVTTREGNVARVLSRNHPEVNFGWLCDKGRFAFSHLRADDRITTPLRRVRRRGFEPVDLEEAVNTAEQGLRDAEGRVAVALSGAETLEQAAALARLVRQGLGSDLAILPDDFHPALEEYRAPLSAIAEADVCLVLGDDPVIERAPIVDLWLRAAGRAGSNVITINPAGSVAVAPGSAASAAAKLASRPTKDLRDTHEALHNAGRVAVVWSEDDPTNGARVAALAQALEAESIAVYFLPRSPNGRGVAQAWYGAGDGRGQEPTGEETLGALIISGDEAIYDDRVRELAEKAEFVVSSAMFMSELTGWSHLVLPGSSYLERDGSTVNLEGRVQRQGRAVAPPFEDELVWLSALARRFDVAVDPWPDVSGLGEIEPLPAAGPSTPAKVERVRPTEQSGSGLQVVRFRSLFSGAAVDRVAELEFQRPSPEVELARADALAREVRTGDRVIVSSNGTSRELRARINRRLRKGVVRIADIHASDLDARVEVTKAP